MSITDELRDWAHEHLYKSGIRSDLLAIADRIDAEHERLMEERADRYSELRTILKERYIELPKDTDEVPWNPGDRDEDGNVVTHLMLTSDGWYVITDGIFSYHPERRRHYHASTVEDVLTEFGIDWEHESDCEDRAALLKEYAAKLRLAETEDA